VKHKYTSESVGRKWVKWYIYFEGSYNNLYQPAVFLQPDALQVLWNVCSYLENMLAAASCGTFSKLMKKKKVEGLSMRTNVAVEFIMYSGRKDNQL
jgi:hypothetical protein